MFKLTYRKVYIAMLILAVVALGFDGYLQSQMTYVPCASIFLERLLVLIVGFLFLIGALFRSNIKSAKILISVLALILCLVGLYVSGHHAWIQYVSQGAGMSSGPDPQSLSFVQFLLLGLKGSGMCAKVNWQYLGLTLPVWAFVLFLIFGLGSLWQLLRQTER